MIELASNVLSEMNCSQKNNLHFVMNDFLNSLKSIKREKRSYEGGNSFHFIIDFYCTVKWLVAVDRIMPVLSEI